MATFIEYQHSSRLGAAQIVAVGAASAASTTFGSQTRQIRIATTGACHFRIGQPSATTAVATDPLLPTGVVDYVTVGPGQVLAVIQDGASTGNISITEIA